MKPRINGDPHCVEILKFENNSPDHIPSLLLNPRCFVLLLLHVFSTPRHSGFSSPFFPSSGIAPSNYGSIVIFILVSNHQVRKHHPDHITSLLLTLRCFFAIPGPLANVPAQDRRSARQDCRLHRHYLRVGSSLIASES